MKCTASNAAACWEEVVNARGPEYIELEAGHAGAVGYAEVPGAQYGKAQPTVHGNDPLPPCRGPYLAPACGQAGVRPRRGRPRIPRNVPAASHVVTIRQDWDTLYE